MTDASHDRPIGTPAELEHLVAYQEGSVVSRTLLKNQGGTLTVFAFGEGQGLSEHSTPHDASVLILDGSAVVTIDGEEHRVSRGQMLHLPAGVPHALRAPESFKMLLVMLKTG